MPSRIHPEITFNLDTQRPSQVADEINRHGYATPTFPFCDKTPAQNSGMGERLIYFAVRCQEFSPSWCDRVEQFPPRCPGNRGRASARGASSCPTLSSPQSVGWYYQHSGAALLPELILLMTRPDICFTRLLGTYQPVKLTIRMNYPRNLIFLFCCDPNSSRHIVDI